MSRRGSVLQDYGGVFPAMSQEAQLAAASYHQRDKELAAQQNQQNKNAKSKGQGDGIDYITGLKPDHVGDTTIDLHTDAQVKGLQDKLIDMALKGAGVNEIKIAAMPELQKISQGYTIAKDEYAKVVNGVRDFSKDYPTADMEAVRSLAGKEMLNNIFEYDENGKIKGYKDPSLISKDKNYLQDLTTNENLPKWYNRSNAFEKGIKDLPLIPVKGGTTRTDKKGGRIKQTYTGHGSVFDEPVINDAGEQSGWRLKSEAVPLGRNPDGSLIIEEVMPKEQFEMAMSTPSARLDFQYDFNKQLQESGIDPDQLDPRAKDVLQRKFAFDLFQNTGIHGSSFLTTDEIKEAPIKNITNVRVSTGKEPPPVMDIVTPVRKYFETNEGKMKEGYEGLAQINLFNNEVTAPIIAEVKSRYPEITADNIYYKKEGNDIWVMKADNNGKIDRKNDTPIFKLDDFSNVAGNKPQGVKSKNEALRQAQSGGKQPANNGAEKPRSKDEERYGELWGKANVTTGLSKSEVNEYKALSSKLGKKAEGLENTNAGGSKKFNIVDPNTGKIIMKDVDEASANKAKAKGYKVQ